MKKLIAGTLAAVALLVAATPAFAVGDCRTGWYLVCRTADKKPTSNPNNDPANNNGGPPTYVAAPEVDAGSAALGVGLLVAAVLLVAEGLRRRR